MNQKITFENVNTKYTRAVATIPVQGGRREAKLTIMRAINGNFFYVRQSTYAGAEAVFPSYREVQQYYKALRGVTEEQFLNAMSLGVSVETL